MNNMSANYVIRLAISNQYVINDENNDAVWNQYDANWEDNPFLLDDNAHVILKRDADDVPLEGAANETKEVHLNSDPLVAAESELSGNEPVFHTNSSLPEETPFDTAKDQIADDSPKGANEQIEEAPIEPAQHAQDEVVAVEEPAVQSADDSATDEKSAPVDEAVASGSLNQTEPVLEQKQQAAEELVPVPDVSESGKGDEEKNVAPDEESVPAGDVDVVVPIDQDPPVVEPEEQQPVEEPQPVADASDKESEPAGDVDAVGPIDQDQPVVGQENQQPADEPEPVADASEPIQDDDVASDLIPAPAEEEETVDAVVPVDQDGPELDLDEQQTVEEPKSAANASEAVNIDDDEKDIGSVDETALDKEEPSVDAEFGAALNISGAIEIDENAQDVASDDEQSEGNNAESNVEEHEILKEPSLVEPVYYGNETEEHVPSGENGDELSEQEQELLNENQESVDTNDDTGDESPGEEPPAEEGVALKENENGIDTNSSAGNEELGGEAAVIALVPLTENRDSVDVNESAAEENPVVEEEQPIVEGKEIAEDAVKPSEGEPAGVEENGDSASDGAPPQAPDSPPQDSDKKEEDVASKPSSDDDSDLNPPPLIHNISTETPASSSDKSTSSSSEDAVEATQKPKEAEVVDDHQSGNAILLKNPHTSPGSSVEGSDTDKLLSNSPVNANSKSLATENEPQPNTGESTTNVSKAGKDATILIVLFVIVIIIGAAALTHHFIKKRKEKISEQAEVGNGIRMADKNSEDIEKGTEMKPLIKSNNTLIVKEYSDKKNDAA
ncbi:hypothetical protein HUJ05_010220 [Dendroctonus ponderosae]|nr:hypothetical protein HUJ05_010220 [Dendroctonus ponderosae]